MESEPLMLAVSADHRLAAEPVVSLIDLRTEAFITYANRDSSVNDAVFRSCHAAGFVPQREPGTAVLLALVAAGLGVAVVPASAASPGLEGVIFRDLAAGGTVDLVLARRHDEDGAVVNAVIRGPLCSLRRRPRVRGVCRG